MEETEFKPALLVFAHKEGEYYHYYLLTEEHLNNGQKMEDIEECQPWCSKKEYFKYNMSGGVYKVKSNGSQVSYNKNTPPHATWKNQDDRIAWKAKQVASTEAGKTLKELKESVLTEALSPIAEAYRHASFSQRRIILAEVIRIITRQ